MNPFVLIRSSIFCVKINKKLWQNKLTGTFHQTSVILKMKLMKKVTWAKILKKENRKIGMRKISFKWKLSR